MTSLTWWGELSVLEAHVVAAFIKGTLILIAAIGLCLALKRGAAAVRHLVWSIALTGLVALPLLSVGLPVWRLAVLPAPDPASTVDSETALTTPLSQHESRFASTALPSHSYPVPATAEEISLEPKTQREAGGSPVPTAGSSEWIRWAFRLWLVGILVMLCRLLIGITNIWWIARRASRVVDPRALRFAVDIASQIGLKRRVPILESHRTTMPIACGVLRPRILLPAEAEDWTDERLQVVLLHELAHVKRWDCLTQLMGQLAFSVYWFNPLVWFASRQLRIERERACDDQVIYLGTKASDYAGHLLDMARSFRSGWFSSPATLAIARRSQLEGRLIAILDPSLKRRGLNRLAAVAAVAVILCVLLPLASLRLSAQTGSYRAPNAQIASDSLVRADAPKTQSEQYKSSQPASAGPTTAQLAQTAPDASDSTIATQQKDNSPVIEALREALKDEDPKVRQQALFALSQVDDQQAITALVEALKNPSWQTRANAASGLGLRGDRNSVEALVSALQDSNWQVREQAAWALGLRGDSRSVEPLIETLKDDSTEVREKSAWALGLKGDRRAVEPLISALKDQDKNVRGMAAWALGLKTDSRAGDALREALKDSDKDVRQKAAWALGMLLMKLGGTPTAIPDSDDDGDAETEPNQASGGVPGGVNGGISGGVPGGVKGGIPRGVLGGIPNGVRGGVNGGVPGGVSGGIPGGVPGSVGKHRLTDPRGSGPWTLEGTGPGAGSGTGRGAGSGTGRGAGNGTGMGSGSGSGRLPGGGVGTTKSKSGKSTSTTKPKSKAKPK